MGLDTSHNAFHGSYPAFTRFRNALAEAAGYEIITTSPDFIPTPNVDYGKFELRNYKGVWREGEEQEDPLMYLIIHSDCDGKIYPKQAELIADRIIDLLPKLQVAFHPRAAQFVAGLRDAIRENEPVGFH